MSYWNLTPTQIYTPTAASTSQTSIYEEYFLAVVLMLSTRVHRAVGSGGHRQTWHLRLPTCVWSGQRSDRATGDLNGGQCYCQRRTLATDHGLPASSWADRADVPAALPHLWLLEELKGVSDSVFSYIVFHFWHYGRVILCLRCWYLRMPRTTTAMRSRSDSWLTSTKRAH